MTTKIKWTEKDWEKWVEQAKEYLRDILISPDSKAHLIDEIAKVHYMVEGLQHENRVLRKTVLDMANSESLTNLERALLGESK